ncbi:hypothetical protein PR202_ga04537 [Eleusine coracana subsp. coracana]|uniref:Endonuclease/exonuclease/phosphatase domain-containing protein n=1 Tax=Eleusine coracana subsp. coracana TaxID=191504 RepID=A0AAV5BPV8_ELECO|nr:hypothetical protein PR202_ga04537 [Eleusine coracana subsp. coracana]
MAWLGPALPALQNPAMQSAGSSRKSRGGRRRDDQRTSELVRMWRHEATGNGDDQDRDGDRTLPPAICRIPGHLPPPHHGSQPRARPLGAPLLWRRVARARAAGAGLACLPPRSGWLDPGSPLPGRFIFGFEIVVARVFIPVSSRQAGRAQHSGALLSLCSSYVAARDPPTPIQPAAAGSPSSRERAPDPQFPSALYSLLFLNDSRYLRIRFCKRRMSTQAQPRFVPLRTEQSESQTDAGAAGHQFRLVTYNILAQVYVKSSIFPHSPSACLKWKSRSKAVLTELKSFDADLMCLQELDEYDTFYKKNMESSGYSSIYIQRSGDKKDGCGIFYKPKSADLVQKETIHYNDLVEQYVPSDHVNSAPSNNSSPEDETNAKSDNNKRGDPNDPRLNGYHIFQVYNYLVSANLESTEDEAPIKLRSLYAANGGEPEFTNYTPGFTGTLDYIFLSDGSSVKPTSLLRLPRGDSADVQGGLPNFQHPSDHLPIGADFLVANS